MKKMLVVSWCAFTVMAMTFSSFAAKTCTWKGGSGDWNVAGNWEEGAVPEDGDMVVLNSGASPAAINNGIPGLSLAHIGFYGTAPITLTGNGYTLTGAEAWTNAVLVINSVPIKVNNANNKEVVFRFNASATFDNEMEIVAAKDVLLKATTTAKVVFNGPVFGKDAVLYASGGGNSPPDTCIWFNKPVTVKAFSHDKGWNFGRVYFSAVGNAWESCDAYYYGTICAGVARAFPENTVLRWATGGKADGGYVLGVDNGNPATCDQIVDRIESEATTYGSFKIGLASTWRRYTLTLKGTKSASCYALLANNLNLTWDPVGDYTQTFMDMASTFAGYVTVNRGTLKISGTASWANVPKLTVRGGAFEVDSSASGSLAALTSLELGPKAVFRVTENAAANPFGAASVAGVLDYGAKIEIAAEKTISFTRLDVVGDLPASGTYTGIGHGSDGVTEVSWVEGAGRVAVGNAGIAHTAWKAAVSGKWGDAENWTDGVPTADREAIIAVGGADYKVSIDGAATMPKRLTVASADGHATTLSVEAPVSFTCATLEVQGGGKITVPPGGKFSYSGLDGEGARMMSSHAGYPIKIGPGGTFEVAGGDVSFTNVCGDALVYGGDGCTGTVSVLSGRFYYGIDYNKNTTGPAYDWFVLDPGGAFVQTGGIALIEHSHKSSGSVFQNRGGVLKVTGGTFGPLVEGGALHAYGTYFGFGGGENVFAGTATFRTDDTLRIAPATEFDELSLTFRDQARLEYKNDTVEDSFVIGGQGRTVVDVQNDFCSGKNFGTAIWLGCRAGSGEMNIDGGTVRVGGRGLIVGGEYDATKTSDGATGAINVRNGGELTVAGYGDSGYTPSYLCGVSVGYGACTAVREGRPYDGELNVFGGTVTGRNGDFTVGTGYATGRLLVDGGTVVTYAPTGTADDRVFGVGLGGGIGVCTVSNGTLRVPCNAFVGGANTNVFHSSKKLAAAGWPVDRHDAQGMLTVAGGAVEFGRALVLGADGRGTLEVVGAEGTVSVAGDLVLSNAVENAASGATLSFVLDPVRGVSPVVVAGKVTGGTGSKLVVDLGSYKGRSFWLVKAGAAEGDFETVDVQGEIAKDVVVEKRTDGWRAKVPRGLFFMIR